MKMTNGLMIVALLAASMSMPAMAQQGSWLLRLGPTWVGPNDDSGIVEGKGGVADIPRSGVDVDDAWTVGISGEYMFTDNFGVELLGVLWPPTHDLDGSGSISALGNIGDTMVLPPTLTANFHFDTGTAFKPYIGVGFNYTLFLDEDASSSLETALGGKTSIDIDDSFGLAGHAGIDYYVNENFFLNVGVWYIDIQADAELRTKQADGSTARRKVDVDIDPWVVMFGGGYRF